jgi:hypothetical protein
VVLLPVVVFLLIAAAVVQGVFSCRGTMCWWIPAMERQNDAFRLKGCRARMIRGRILAISGKEYSLY